MFENEEPIRARRRRRTVTVATRRRSDHLNLAHGGDATTVNCICELAVWYFAKRPALGCNCRKRTHGRPRVDCGMCEVGRRDRIYRWRNQSRELQRAVRSHKDLELDSDFVALITSSKVEP